jgi:hypothetical protein
MHGKGWLRVLGDGLLAGLVASLLMTLVMLLLRDRLGIATPEEMVGDRLAPRWEGRHLVCHVWLQSFHHKSAHLPTPIPWMRSQKGKSRG